jgi:hypothetical protein
VRKKRRLVQIKPDETSVHSVGQERFIRIQRYTGDFPSGEPNDWFPQSDEYDTFLSGTIDTNPHEYRR